MLRADIASFTKPALVPRSGPDRLSPTNFCRPIGFKYEAIIGVDVLVGLDSKRLPVKFGDNTEF